MVSRENKILVAFAALALASFLVLSAYTDLSTQLLLAILVLLGVVVPQAILGRTSTPEE